MSGLRRPLVLPRPTYYDSTSEYNSIDDSLNRVEYFSNAVLEDQYDAALRSRGRDDALLRNANATIYRLDSRVNPADIIYEPASYARLRQQLQDVNGKMDRERQLLDRYLDTENMSRSKLWRAEEAKKLDGSVNIPSYYACGGDPLNRPVTELRRKIRRMVATGKRNPNYYRMGLDA